MHAHLYLGGVGTFYWHMSRGCHADLRYIVTNMSPAHNTIEMRESNNSRLIHFIVWVLINMFVVTKCRWSKLPIKFSFQWVKIFFFCCKDTLVAYGGKVVSLSSPCFCKETVRHNQPWVLTQFEYELVITVKYPKKCACLILGHT